MAVNGKSINDFDPYATLGLSNTGATREEVSKAARKLGLKYHPDKNPNPTAQATFLAIQQAKELLLDEGRRKEYDSKRSAREKRKHFEEQRGASMDTKRKKFRSDLEMKISAQKKSGDDSGGGDNNVKARPRRAEEEAARNGLSAEQVKRRKQGEKVLAEMLDRNRRTATSATASIPPSTAPLALNPEPAATEVKVKWRKSAVSQSEESLYTLFKGYGQVEEVRLTGSKGTAAIVSYGGSNSRQAGEAAVQAFTDNHDFKVTLAAEDKDAAKRASVFTYDFPKADALQNITSTHSPGRGNSGTTEGVDSGLIRDIARLVERHTLLRATEAMEATASASRVSVEERVSGHEDEGSRGEYDLSLYTDISYEQVLEKERALLARF